MDLFFTSTEVARALGVKRQTFHTLRNNKSPEHRIHPTDTSGVDGRWSIFDACRLAALNACGRPLGSAGKLDIYGRIRTDDVNAALRGAPRWLVFDGFNAGVTDDLASAFAPDEPIGELVGTDGDSFGLPVTSGEAQVVALHLVLPPFVAKLREGRRVD